MIKPKYRKGLDFSQLARSVVERAIAAPLTPKKITYVGHRNVKGPLRQPPKNTAKKHRQKTASPSPDNKIYCEPFSMPIGFFEGVFVGSNRRVRA